MHWFLRSSRNNRMSETIILFLNQLQLYPVVSKFEAQTDCKTERQFPGNRTCNIGPLSERQQWAHTRHSAVQTFIPMTPVYTTRSVYLPFIGKPRVSENNFGGSTALAQHNPPVC